MPRVDFYVLGSAERETLWRLACRITEKAWLAGNTVFVHADSPHEAARLDEVMWTFKQDSFVPHALYPPQTPDWPPVLVGCGAEPERTPDVLVNLSEAVPEFFERFERIAELVGGDPAAREKGRARYRHYRERGCTLHSHNL